MPFQESYAPGGQAERFSIYRRESAKLGYHDLLVGLIGQKAGLVGQGVGLEIDEYPVIGPVDHKILENLTIAIKPKIIFPGLAW